MQKTVIRVPNPYLPEWLHHKHSQNEPVSPDDVIRVVDYDHSAAADPIVCEYLLRAARGELKRKVGRPVRTALGKLKLHLAARQVEVLTRWYVRAAERGYDYASDPKREGLGLSEFVHEQIARRMKLGSGRSLANSLCSLKSCPF